MNSYIETMALIFIGAILVVPLITCGALLNYGAYRLLRGIWDEISGREGDE